MHPVCCSKQRENPLLLLSLTIFLTSTMTSFKLYHKLGVKPHKQLLLFFSSHICCSAAKSFKKPFNFLLVFSLLGCELPQRSLGGGCGGLGLGAGPGPWRCLGGLGLFDCRSRHHLGGSGGEATGSRADLQHCTGRSNTMRRSDADGESQLKSSNESANKLSQSCQRNRGGTSRNNSLKAKLHSPCTVCLDLACASGTGSLPLLWPPSSCSTVLLISSRWRQYSGFPFAKLSLFECTLARMEVSSLLFRPLWSWADSSDGQINVLLLFTVKSIL